MLKLLIVDDERIIRDGLKKRDIWKELGFSEVCVAANGKEALELIPDVNPDVVLTDIRMPLMDGLELLSEINTRYSNIKTIILSTYNDFEFARKGMELGAKAYLLKPTSNDEISRIFKDIVDACKKEALQKQENKKSFIHYMLNDIIIGKEPQKKIDIFDHVKNSRLFISCISFFITYKNKKSKVALNPGELIALIKQSLSFQSEVFNAENGNDYSFFIICPSAISEEHTAETIEYISSSLCSIFPNTEVTFGVSQIHKDINNISTVMKESQTALETSFYTGIGTRNYYKEQNLKSDEAAYDKLCKNIADGIVSGNSSSCKRYLLKFFEAAIKLGLSKDYLIKQCVLIDEKIKFKAEEKGTYDEAMFKYLSELTVSKLQSFLTISELQKFITDKFNHIAEKIAEEHNDKSNKILRMVYNYVEKNYQNKISISEIASFVFMSPAYFSVYFKKKTGVNFSDYVASVRINKSKELLSNCRYKIYEVAEKVGFSDESYFSKVFKKIEGTTPQNYIHNVKGS